MPEEGQSKLSSSIFDSLDCASCSSFSTCLEHVPGIGLLWLRQGLINQGFPNIIRFVLNLSIQPFLSKKLIDCYYYHACSASANLSGPQIQRQSKGAAILLAHSSLKAVSMLEKEVFQLPTWTVAPPQNLPINAAKNETGSSQRQAQL